MVHLGTPNHEADETHRSFAAGSRILQPHRRPQHLADFPCIQPANGSLRHNILCLRPQGSRRRQTARVVSVPEFSRRCSYDETLERLIGAR